MISDLFSLTNVKFLIYGFGLTLYIALVTIILGTIFGTVLGVLRNSSKGIPGKLAAIYIETVRNTPMLLWILVTRFIVNMKPVNAGILALTIFSSSIIGEIVRGGLNSIKQGQWEAAESQGFTYIQTLRYVIIPQAFRNMIPALASQFITVIKDTSFLWAVGIEEVTGKGMILMGSYANTTQVFSIFGMIAAMYFTVNYVLSLMFRAQQRRLVLQS